MSIFRTKLPNPLAEAMLMMYPSMCLLKKMKGSSSFFNSIRSTMIRSSRNHMPSKLLLRRGMRLVAPCRHQPDKSFHRYSTQNSNRTSTSMSTRRLTLHPRTPNPYNRAALPLRPPTCPNVIRPMGTFQFRPVPSLLLKAVSVTYRNLVLVDQVIRTET